MSTIACQTSWNRYHVTGKRKHRRRCNSPVVKFFSLRFAKAGEMNDPFSDTEVPLRSWLLSPFVRRAVTALCVIAFAAVVVASYNRVSRHMGLPGEVSGNQQWALADFRDAVYYPTVSFLNGENPYDQQFVEQYPVRFRMSPYTPLFLSLHVPFGVLPLAASQLSYFVFMIVLTLVLSWLSLRMCGRNPTVASITGIAALILVSRPGHLNLMYGQTTLEFVLLVYVALYAALRSSWFSGLALAGATMKVTFGLPLAVLMVVERQYRSVAIGICIAILATLIPTLVLVHAAGGISTLVNTYLECVLGFESAPSTSAVASAYRIDAVAIIGRLSGLSPGLFTKLFLFSSILLVAGLAMRRVRASFRGRAAELFCISVACIAILIATYQQTYGALLLVLPVMALVLNCWAPSELLAGSAARCLLIVLLSVPLVNHLIAPRFWHLFDREGLAWTFLVSMNGIALALAFGVYVWVAFRRPQAAAARSLHDFSKGQGA